MSKVLTRLLCSILISTLAACGQDKTPVAPPSESASEAQGAHPNLLLAAKDLAALRAEASDYPLFSDAMVSAKYIVDEAMAQDVDVPFP